MHQKATERKGFWACSKPLCPLPASSHCRVFRRRYGENNGASDCTIRIPFCMWNDEKVSQCWEISRRNLSADDVGEGLKLVRLCAMRNNWGCLSIDVALTWAIKIQLHYQHVLWASVSAYLCKVKEIWLFSFVLSGPRSLYITHSHTGFSPSPTSSVEKSFLTRVLFSFAGVLFSLTVITAHFTLAIGNFLTATQLEGFHNVSEKVYACNCTNSWIKVIHMII